MHQPIHYGRKRRGIIQAIETKVEDWLKTITDEKVRMAAKKDTIVTGGSIASMLLGERVNDYDIYFRTKETTIAVAQYYADKFADQENGLEGIRIEEVKITNCKGVEEERVIVQIDSDGVAGDTPERDEDDQIIEPEESEEDEDKYRVTFMSRNAITLTHKVQLITRFYGEPDEIHSNYDFVHATCFWDHGTRTLELPGAALECLLSRTLIYRGSLYPIASIFRMKKFVERGWRITAGEQLKIMWQISELDLSDPMVMVEQLTGVDMLYMQALMDALASADQSKINSTYVAEIIDRIFD